MQIEQKKASVVAGWILVLAGLAMSLNVGTTTGWLLLVGLGLVPPMMLFYLWQQPAQTTSESIREVLR